jgi:hypothetical protein
MLDMCLINYVFLQANSCPISEIKSIRHKHVSQRRKEEKTIVYNSIIQLWLIDNCYDKAGQTSYRTWKSLLALLVW